MFKGYSCSVFQVVLLAWPWRALCSVRSALRTLAGLAL